MPLADFTITVEHEDLGADRDVRVVVYATVGAMRAAATRYDRRTGCDDRPNNHTLGVCHRFEWTDENDVSQPLCAIVRLARPHVGAGMIAHELAHATVWLMDLAGKPIVTEDDETFCWILGSLVRRTVNMMNDKGIFDEG